jgi:ribosomal-protein-alanine N-acetyltransferase
VGFRASKVMRKYYEDSGEDAFLMHYRLSGDVGGDEQEGPFNRIAQYES